MTGLEARNLSMKKRCSSFLLFFFIFGMLCSALISRGLAVAKEIVEKEEIVIGFGTVHAGNIAAAREEALDDAMSKAMEDYLVERLGEANMVNNFKRLAKEILPKAKDGIENFHILAKNLDVNQFRVLVRVKINRELIEEKLRLTGITTVEIPNIKILFMVSELMGDTLSYWWKRPETFSLMTQTDVILYRVFQEEGFMPVDRSLGTSDIPYSESMTLPKLEVSDLLQWGKMFSADVVISGRTVFLDESRVFMVLKAISVKEGQELGEMAETGLQDLEKDSSVTADLLLQKVARILVRRMGPSIVKKTFKNPTRIHLFQVQLRGLRNFKEYRALRDFLRKEIPGVQSLKQSRFGGGSVTVTVAFDGEREEFLSRILNREDIPVKVFLEKSQNNEIVLSGRE